VIFRNNKTVLAPMNLVTGLAMTLATALALTACNTGDVQVNNAGSAQGGTQAGQLPGQASSQPGQPGQQQGPGKKADNRKLFFQQVTMDQGLPDQLISIDYVSKNVKNANSDGIPVISQNFNPNAEIVVSGSDTQSVTYLRSMDIGVDAIVTTKLTTEDTEVRFRFPRAVKSFSISGDDALSMDASTWVVAWIDQAGVISIGEDLNPSVGTLKLPDNVTSKKAKTAQWNSSGDRLLVRTESDAVLFKADSQGLVLDRVYSGVSASAFDKSGSKIALVETKGSALQVVNLALVASEKTEAQINLDSSVVHDFSWNSGGFLYWARLQSGLSEVRFLSYKSDKGPGVDVKSEGEITVAQLGIPGAVQDGVVCPSWSGDQVYFSDFDNGQYVIEKASLNVGKFMGATQFIKPLMDSTDGEGFVCPKF
jgi:hypothetical protein